MKIFIKCLWTSCHTRCYTSMLTPTYPNLCEKICNVIESFQLCIMCYDFKAYGSCKNALWLLINPFVLWLLLPWNCRVWTGRTMERSPSPGCVGHFWQSITRARIPRGVSKMRFYGIPNFMGFERINKDMQLILCSPEKRSEPWWARLIGSGKVESQTPDGTSRGAI